MTVPGDDRAQSLAPWLFAFDLDGMLSRERFLPSLAALSGREREMEEIIRRSREENLPFAAAFRLRFAILKTLPLSVIQERVAAFSLDAAIDRFIRTHSSCCALITDIPDRWITPLTARLNCRVFCTTTDEGGKHIRSILRKDAALRFLRQEGFRIALVSNAVADSPMFHEADAVLAFGGTHASAAGTLPPPLTVFQDGPSLERTLEALAVGKEIPSA